MYRSRFALSWILVLLACVAACSSKPEPVAPDLGSVTSAATVASDFAEGLYVGGLASPTTMAFAPDGRLFVCEQAGRLRVIDANGVLLPTPFLNVSSPTAGEQGLVGITFDPNFESNHFVYVYYTMTTPTQHNRLSRWTANGNVAVPGSEVVLYEGGTTQSTIHNGGALHFGRDGKLYVAVGEDATGQYAQQLTNTWGKILRFNADGTIPTDNPFFAMTSGTSRAIWALGLRNPFTFDIQRSTGRMFINDVGQDTWEEINDGVAGANFGWPLHEGTSADPVYRNPIFAYMHGSSDSTGCAVTGGAFYDPATIQFPSSYVGDYFYADYCNNWIRRLDVNGATVTSSAFLQGAVAPVDIDVGPEGALYYLNRGDGTVHRVTYAPAGAPPTILTPPASATVAPGQSATFSVGTNGSSPLSFQWQRNGSNIPGAVGTTYTLSATALADSGASFRVIVTNPFGTATSAAATLTVTTDLAPSVSIDSPAVGATYSGGQTISYSASAVDAEDGPLPPSAFSWRVVFHHDQHIHPFLENIDGVASGTFQIPNIGHTETDVWYRIELSVRDSVGHVVTASRDIQPAVVPITLVTSPAGLTVSLDGTPRAGGYTEPSVAGVRRTLSAATIQSIGGVLYQFQSWSDGGAQSHDIATPSVATTYTATYVRVTGGLSGQYFNETNLTAPVLTRVDPRIDFDFGEAAPAAGVAADGYSIRWTGQIIPLYSESYRFFTLSDDGVRLWINNVLVVDNWTNHGPTENSGTVMLSAGVPVPIRLEYYNAWGGAVIRLSWESATQALEVVPQQQLREPDSTQPPPPPPPGTPPVVVTQPTGTIVGPGDAATFTVIASGTAPLTYQWQRNGVDIPGATAASYALASATLADSGAAFRAVITNAFGTVTSLAGTLTVTANATNGLRGEYFNEMNLTALVLARTDATVDFDFGELSPVPGVHQETYSIRWTGQVVPRFTQTYTFFTLSDDGVRLWVNDVQVINNWTNHGPTENSGTIALTAGVPVSIRLEHYNIWGGATIRLSWSSSSQARQIVPQSQLLTPGSTPPPPPPLDEAPAIVTPPANASVTVGQPATFSVTASGTAPLSYQWQRNGSNVAGATGSSYTTGATTPADNGASFRVVVTNAVGSVTSAAALLSVTGNAPAIVTPPASASVTVGQPVTFSVTASGTAPLAYQWQRNGSNIAGATAASYTIASAALADSGATFRVVVTNTFGSVTSAGATLTVTGSAPAIATAPASTTVAPGQPATFSATATGTAPLTYQWQRNGTNIAGATSASYTLAAAAAADNGASFRVVVTNAFGSATSTAATLTVSGSAPAIVTQPANVTVPPGQSATFSVSASGTAPLTYQWQRGGTNIAGATSASFTLGSPVLADSGASFRVVVTNAFGSVTSTAATLTVSGSAPAIVTAPASVTVAPGQPATFSVSASGTAPLSYQWQRNSSNIAGATSASYTLASAAVADSGANFRVVVTNAFGSATSTAAILTVNGTAPAIVTAPASTTVAPGQAATFSVTASGTAPLSYQWQRDGTNIAGATATSYSLVSPVAADSGAAFRVVVTNAFGSVTSAAATLIVSTSTGNGLRGEYFDEMDLTIPVLARTDATVDFDFGEVSPVPGVHQETYSVRWTGQVVPRFTQTYTFFTLSDDGVRLWVNDVQVINNWTNHGPTENSGTIALTAGVPASIRLEFYNIWGGATIRLSWSSSSQAREIIPTSQLILPGTTTPPPPPPPPPPGSFAVTLDSVSSNKAYTLGTIGTGSSIYIDRNYTVTALAPALVGARYIRTANDDKNLTTATHLRFTPNAASTVYVAYDSRGTLPNWLRSGWEQTTMSFVATDSGGTLTRRVYRRNYPAGQITLGGNVQPPGSGAGTHYIVLVQPQ